MDVSVRQELSSLIEELTHSGAPSLSEEPLKKVKQICKTSDAYTRAVYNLVMDQLVKKHAEIRLSTFQIINELFMRSHTFRELLISDFQKLTCLVTGTDHHHPLPAPKPAAALLKEKSLLAIRNWSEKFGEGYPKLKLGFNYLKYTKKVDFQGLVAQSEAVRRQQEERAARQTAMIQQRIQEVKQEMRELKYDMEDCLTQMEACFNLLLPRFDIPDSSTHLQADSKGKPPTTSVANSKGKEEKRRTISSGSFASLSSIDNECCSDEESLSDVSVVDTSKEHVGEVAVDPASFSRLSNLFQKGSVICSAKGKERAKGGPCDSGEAGEGVDSEGVSSSSDDSDVEWEDVGPGDTSKELLLLQEHGFASRGYTIPIEIPSSSHVPIKETEDNSSILAALRETHHILTDKYLPAVSRWMGWLTRAGDDESLRTAIDIKNKLLSAFEKYNRLDITYVDPPSPKKGEAEDSEVGGEQNANSEGEAVRRVQPEVTDTQWRITDHSGTKPNVELELDPTTAQAQIIMLRKKVGLSSSLSDPPATDTSLQGLATPSLASSSNSSKGLRARAPVVPFGMDLFHWGSTDELEHTLTSMDSLHRYWAPEHDVVPSEDAKAQVKYRTISFMGKFDPVKWTCRAPLPSGKLCPRRDRVKCPLHGPIVARDELGNPVDVHHTSLNLDTHLSSSQPSVNASGGAGPSWQTLPTRGEDSKGAELVSSRKGKRQKGKKKKKKFPGLTDLKAQTDTPKERLERKVLSKKAIRRVADSMDNLNAKKFHDKFGYNFNYALRS